MRTRKSGWIQYSPRCRICRSKKDGHKKQITATPSIKLSDVQAAYIAGLVDGEGSICIYRSNGQKQKRLQYNVNIKIKMAGTFLGELAREVGVGTYRENVVKNQPEHFKKMNQWCWHQAACRCLIPQIRPFLRHKIAQADLAIKFLSLPWKGTMEEKRQICEMCMNLNKRG